MGTNLSQVFISNVGSLEANGGDGADSFGDLANADIGIWSLDKYGSGNDNWIDSALYEKTVAASGATVDTSDTGASDDAVLTQATVAHPLWLYQNIQFVQGTGGLPIASPMIATSNIKCVRFDPYEATAGHKQVITPAATFTAAAVNTVTLKVIIRTTPTDQLSFYDPSGNDFSILSGTDPFPLGAFNTTNHKAISVEFNCTNTATFCSAGKTAVDGHGLLSKLVTATDTGTGTSLDLQSKHVGFTFDVVVLDKDGNEIVESSGNNTVAVATTGQVLGVGNDWQVHGEEIRCRGRYADFNRMYLPKSPKTYTVENNAYHKITVEYAHNWPNSSGIAPAGALNQVVMYFADSSTALAAGDGTIDEAFNLANVTAAQKFVW